MRLQQNLCSPEVQPVPIATGGERLRLVCGGLIIAALVSVLSVTAFYTVCTGFRFWDDMGYLMLTQKTLAAGHALYDQTFTPYGPAYYAWEQLLHAVTRLPLSHDSTLVFTTVSWVVISLLCAGYVARMTRSVLLTALTCFAVFYVLAVLGYEPGHPQELCGLLLGGMLLGSSFLTSGRHKEITLGTIGFFIGLLGMTKPNLGVFAALAGWLSLSNLLAARTSRKVLFGAGALAALVLPVALMRHNLAAAGDYCLLESGAMLLLVGQLAMSQPDRSLSLKTFAAPVAGCAVALLVCAGYALARGTSVAGLIRGLLLQHVDYDRAYSRWPAFATEDVLLSLGLAFALWVATGPGGGFWRTTPWVAALVKFSVAPLMLLIALLAGLDINPTYAWINAMFIWCLPLIAATGQPSARQPKSAGEVAPRQFAVSLAVLNALWGYPVWGSQAMLSFFLLIPVAMVWSADGLRYGYWRGGRMEQLSSFRSKAGGLALSCLAALVIVGLSLFRADSAARGYHRLEPSGLPGSRLLHMPRDQTNFYRRIIQAARAHGRSFFTMPGLGSLYFWADADPPTRINASTPDQQSKTVEDLQKVPDLCVIRWNPLVKFWTENRDISGNKVVRYIEDDFVTVESFDQCDIMVRRAAAGQTGHRQGGPGP